MKRALILAAFLTGAVPAQAADFAGKTVTLFVGAFGTEASDGEGSRVILRPDASFERTGALYARHLSRLLPGRPEVTARALPGAEGVVAAQRLAQVGAADGTTLALLGPNVIRAPLLGGRGATYDPRRFGWIGSRAQDATVCALRAETGVRRIADMASRKLFFGAVDLRQRDYMQANALKRIVGANLRIIAGYSDQDEIIAAMPKGELDGLCGWPLANLRTRYPDLLAGGKLSIVAQFTRDKEPRFAYAPTGREIARTDEERQLFGLIDDEALFGFALAAPPVTTPDTLAALRAAFDAMMRDRDFAAEAAKFGLDVDAVGGETLARAVEALHGAAPALLERWRALARFE